MLREPVTLPESEETQIRELNRMLQPGSPALVGAAGERVELPDSVFRLLKKIVWNMQLGRAVVLIPENQQLTTQSSANLLTYQKRRNTEREAALNCIAKEAFESGLYDRTGIPEGGEEE